MVNINNTELQSMLYNGQEVNTWIHNGIIVWEIDTTELDINALQDFEYTTNNNIYTLTAWKETYNGIASTECIVPDSRQIIL